MVNAGADVNFTNEYNNIALLEALHGGKDAARITRYLLIDKNADFKKTFVVTINGDTTSFAGLLRTSLSTLIQRIIKIKMEESKKTL